MCLCTKLVDHYGITGMQFEFEKGDDCKRSKSTVITIVNYFSKRQSEVYILLLSMQ